ncbi:unnamed protein product, partial [Mesorhabditis belari]|uniref:Adenylate kinase isoenzyme 5 n=1 Tax=Mesorhabditis belari TaxID=2138241 RepID=A0AAF3J6L8_9BILA
MGAEAKAYLQEHGIPQLFEGLMTGLIYNKPDDPLEFLEEALAKVRGNPNMEVSWDMFIKTESEIQRQPKVEEINKENKTTTKKKKVKPKEDKESKKSVPGEKKKNSELKKEKEKEKEKEPAMGVQRVPSVIKAAEVAKIPDVPVVLFMGGPGGGKTRHASRVYNALHDQGLIHICMPDIIRNALAKYKDRFTEWKDANDKYMRGELIPNHLALALVKAEMGRHPQASAYFLEGFPREARQVEDFERQVKVVNMAIIIDYDERTLREHMERRGIAMDVIDQRIKEFKQKTLPSAKYFDDQKLLHLIPGEKDDQTIFERMKKLVEQAMESGVPVYNSNPPAQAVARGDPLSPPGTSSEHHHHKPPTSSGSKPPSTPGSKPASKPSTSHGHHKEERPSSRPGSRSGSASSKRSGSGKSRKAETPLINGHAELAREPEIEREVAAVVETVATVHDPPKTPKTAESVGRARNFPRGLPNNAPVILLIGAPGSNKTSIAQRIAKKYDGFVMFSMGDLLRRKVRETRGDELWDRIGRKIDQGEAVPMKLCRELLYSGIHEIGTTSWGYVIEGYPRNQHQAQDFEQQIDRIDLAVLIDCTEQFCAENVKRRYEEGLQDRTERPDDAVDVFKSRLELFKANCLPMLKYFDDKGKLRVVDGDIEEEKIFNEIIQMIDNSLFIEDNGSGKSLESSKNGSLFDQSGTQTTIQAQ